MKGLEPPCLAAPDPKSGVSTNFTTSAGDELCKKPCKTELGKQRTAKVFFFNN